MSWRANDAGASGSGADDFDDPFASASFDSANDTTTGGITYSSEPVAPTYSTARASGTSFGGPGSRAPASIAGSGSGASTSAAPPVSGSSGGGLGGLLSKFSFGSGADAASPKPDALAGGAGAAFGGAAAASAASLRAPPADYLTAGESRYLHFERRGVLGQMGYNVGYSYFGGLGLGGAIGCVLGLRNAPNRHARILVNSVLNGSGRLGSRVGNAAGVLAMVYTLAERGAEDWELDRLPGAINNALGHDLLPRSRWDAAIPGCAAFATGALFTLPRAITMRGLDRHYVTLPKRAAVVLTGGLLGIAGVAALSVVGPVIFGRRSPFRFASD